MASGAFEMLITPQVDPARLPPSAPKRLNAASAAISPDCGASPKARWSSPGHGRIAAALFIGLATLPAFGADGAADQTFEQRCIDLAKAATATVLYEDAAIAWNTRYDEAQLRRLGAEPNTHHIVLGLTVARPTARMNVRHQSLTEATTGRVCIAGSVALTVGFSEMTVYLASSLTNPCRRRIVEEHELEHVRIWRNHLRAGAQLAKPLIERQLVSPLYAEDQTAAEALLRQRVNDIVAPLIDRIAGTAHAAHRELDTPLSYQAATNRLRACR